MALLLAQPGEVAIPQLTAAKSQSADPVRCGETLPLSEDFTADVARSTYGVVGDGREGILRTFERGPVLANVLLNLGKPRRITTNTREHRRAAAHDKGSNPTVTAKNA